jgi:hypothetical protein
MFPGHGEADRRPERHHHARQLHRERCRFHCATCTDTTGIPGTTMGRNLLMVLRVGGVSVAYTPFPAHRFTGHGAPQMGPLSRSLSSERNPIAILMACARSSGLCQRAKDNRFRSRNATAPPPEPSSTVWRARSVSSSCHAPRMRRRLRLRCLTLCPPRPLSSSHAHLFPGDRAHILTENTILDTTQYLTIGILRMAG